MENKKVLELADKLRDFNFSLGCWNAQHTRGVFNVNGKGNRELSYRQFQLLIAIHATGVDTVSGLEHLIHISKSSLSLTISKMERSGYLTKDHLEGETDGRKVHLRLTKKGESVLEDMNRYYHQMFSEFYHSLDGKRKKNLETGIEKLNLVFK